MSVHYEPNFNDNDDYFADYTYCGTRIGEQSQFTGSWNLVNCKKCLKRKEKIMQVVESEQQAAIEQYGAMADYFSNGDGK